MERLASEGKKVTRFSITGYSLGGLVARYVVGILYQRKFFEVVTPVNFNTCATPHIGLPRYSTMFSFLAQYIGPKLLSRTGEQFYATDKWSASGRPLLEVMADPDRVFYQALSNFAHLQIYANAVNDTTVPYPTAAIEPGDPFVDHATSGIEIEFDEQYEPVIKSWRKPEIPPEREQVPLSRRVLNKLTFTLPPPLQFPFPFNILVYAAVPVLMPMLLMLILTRLSLDSRKSRVRVQLLEKSGSESSTERLVHTLARLEREMETAMVGLIDNPGTAPSSPPRTPPASDHDSELGLGAGLSADADETLGKESKVMLGLHPSATPPAPEQQHVMLTELQLKLVRTLNTLPHLQKTLVFIHPVRNSHAVIISRDVKRFEAHRRGEGVLRHWADHFII